MDISKLVHNLPTDWTFAIQPMLRRRFRFIVAFIFFYRLLLRLRLDRYFAKSLNPFYASINIDHSQEVFRPVLEWASQKFVNSRNLKIARLEHQDMANENDPSIFRPEGRDSTSRYEPSFGTHVFFYDNLLFFFTRTQDRTRGIFRQGNEEGIELATFWPSTAPIKDLLYNIASSKLAKMTTIWMPRPNNERHFGPWKLIQRRSVRPLNTVILDHSEKEGLLKDMKEFWKPSKRQWYARKGIPWRRGYLFSGEPGAGKTSLALAAAGALQAPVYIVNIADPDIGDSVLMTLFNSLPERCFIILEDIDAARIGQSRDEDSEIDRDGSTTSNGVSFAGLLNALDGVTSANGRILIMTTNYVQRLDKALIRPGRVDYRIDFTFVNRSQIREMFIQLYKDDTETTNDTENMKLIEMAGKFAAALPENTYSSAEIQGFLITRDDAQQALEDVGEWDCQMKEKKAKEDHL